MTVKEYLSQAAYLDRLIDGKLEQLEELRKITCSSGSIVTVSEGVSSNVSRVHRTVEKICLMEEEINRQIDRYVDVKDGISKLIMSVPDLQQRLVLEQHYLLFLTWEQIAEKCYMSLRNVQYIHKKALAWLERDFDGGKSA